MAIPVSLAVYQFLGRIQARGQKQNDTGSKWAPRPPGRLMWLHAPEPGDLGVIVELILQLSDHDPDLWFLLTTDDEPAGPLPEQCFHARLPADMRPEMSAFLDHWHPNLLVWTAGQLYPALTFLAAERTIPLLLLDTGAAFETTQGLRHFPGLNRKTLRKFSTILSGDEATSLALISNGARSETVQTTGVLEQGINPPGCNDAEWDTLAKMLAARPIWLAARIDVDELGSVLTAHKQSLLRSHRLLLILVPSSEDVNPEFEAILKDSDLIFSQRSQGDEPAANDQVYLADTEDEIGLWYRLAPVTFMGQTLAGRSGFGPNPFDAATLGSVVIHGPKTGAHQVAYNRMARAGASRSVSHMGELALAVEALLSPDRAATMAHAAWQITSAGAEVMEATIETLLREIKAGPST